MQPMEAHLDQGNTTGANVEKPAPTAPDAAVPLSAPAQSTNDPARTSRHITTALHCQAAVVRIGESFGTFDCIVFYNTASPSYGADGGMVVPLFSRTVVERGRGGVPVRQRTQKEYPTGAPRASITEAIALQNNSTAATTDTVAGDDVDDHFLPVRFPSAEVPRWQLLIYSLTHHNKTQRRDTDTADECADSSLDELPLPPNASVSFFQTLPTTKLSKVVKLEAGCRFTVLVRCYAKATSQWSAWSEPVHTATQYPVETRIVEIGTDYVHCTWDRALRRCEDAIAPEKDPTTTDWVRSIPNFELRFLRESDMAEHYVGSFETGCRTHTVRGLDPATPYIVFARYMTMINTMREWTEVTRLVTENLPEVHLQTRGEDTFTVGWSKAATVAPTAALHDASAGPSAFLADGKDRPAPAVASTTTCVGGYLLPRIPVHEYEVIIESTDLRFDPVTLPASASTYMVPNVYPSTSYTVCVRALSAEGRWGCRSDPLLVRTADRPVPAVVEVSETFACIAWNRPHEETNETRLEYCVKSLTSNYTRRDSVELPSPSAPVPHRLSVDHLRAGKQYTLTLRVCLDTTWGQWTEPVRLATVPGATLTFLERGENFFTVNWPSTDLVPSSAIMCSQEELRYNIVVVRCDDGMARTAVLNERVTYDSTQRGFTVKSLEPDTRYEVQCRTWQRNPVTGEEDWGEFSVPMQVSTLQPVALHVWDVGEDFIHIKWRRGLSDTAAGVADAEEWTPLRYEVVLNCVDTGEADLLHRQVLDTNFSMAQLKPCTTYSIAVRACDEQGQWGIWSRVQVRTLATLHTSVNEIGEDFVRLLWHRESADSSHGDDAVKVTAADAFVVKYSVLVYAVELPGVPVAPHVQSGYQDGGGRSDVVQHHMVTSEHTSLRVGDLLPDREYVAVVRSATTSGRWGVWSAPLHLRTNPQFRIPAHQLSIGENYVNVVWSRAPTVTQDRDSTRGSQPPVAIGDLTVTGQELRIRGVTTQYVKEYTLEAGVRELKVPELRPACAYTLEIRARGGSASWGLWSAPVHIMTRGTIVVSADEVAEDFMTVRWERRKVANPHQYPTGRGVVTSYHLRVYSSEGVYMETFLGDGDCPYRVTGLTANTYYCVEMKANYNDEEWGLWSVPLWSLTMQPIRVQTKLISEEFCCLRLERPGQQRRLPEDDGNPSADERVLAHGQVRPTIMLCVTSPIFSKTPYKSTSAAASDATPAKASHSNDALPPDATKERLVYQTVLQNSAETVEHTVPNLRCNTVYSVSARTKLASGEWGMWSPSLLFATVPATKVAFTSIGENFAGVEWERHTQTIPAQIASPMSVVRGVATITASRVRVRENGGAYQRTYTVDGAATSLRVGDLNPATTYCVCVQTFNDNYEWGVWSEEEKVRTVPGMDIDIQHTSEDAVWVSWSRATDLDVSGDVDTAINVSISARLYEICILGEHGFTYRQETTSMALFFRGLLPDAVCTMHVRALFAQSDFWGLWSTQAFRTKPRLRASFGNIGDHFVMLEWRRHLPTRPETELHFDATVGGCGDTQSVEAADVDGAASAVMMPRADGTSLSAVRSPHVIAETEDIVLLYRFKVQRVGVAQAQLYTIAPTVSSFRLRDLLPSSEYRVWVCAQGYEGVWGFWSEESRVRTLPRLVLRVRNIGEDYVRASWQRGIWDGVSMPEEEGVELRQVDGAVSGYEVRVMDAEDAVVATSTTTSREASTSVGGLQLSTRYEVQVRAKDTYEAWGLWSDPVAFYTLTPATVGLKRVGETFAELHWSRHTLKLVRNGDLMGTFGDDEKPPSDHAADEKDTIEEEGMRAGEDRAVHPDSRVRRWHLRLSCSRVFAGMPQSEDYREHYAEGPETSLNVNGLLPHATYTVTVRGLNYAEEWGHWSPPLYVATYPLLRVEVETSGETFLQMRWWRPTAQAGELNWSAAEDEATNLNAHDTQAITSQRTMGTASETVSVGRRGPHQLQSDLPLHQRQKRLSIGEGDVAGLKDEDEMEEGGSAFSSGSISSLASSTPCLCFPAENEIHNYQVTIRPMPTEEPFEEAEEPLVDGARVYETTQPALRLANLLPGVRYAVTVREQLIDVAGRPVAGDWGAASETMLAATVPAVRVMTEEVGEDYCQLKWSRAALAESGMGNSGGGIAADAPGSPSGRKTVKYQLQTRRLALDGLTLYEGPLARDSLTSVASNVSSYYVSDLEPNSVYAVRVRAKSENGQWGIWSLPATFMTRSRLSVQVSRVQEVSIRLTWSRGEGATKKDPSEEPLEVAADVSVLLSQNHEPPLDGTTSDAPVATTTTTMTATTSTSVLEMSTHGVATHVQFAEDAVQAYEVVMEGLSCDYHRTVTVDGELNGFQMDGLTQNELYCVSVRSLSAQQHWSNPSPKVSVLTQAAVAMRVARYTESTALLEWHRPAPDVGRFAELCASLEKAALQHCEARERQELLDLKRRLQVQDERGDTPKKAELMDPAAREEHNAAARAEATSHLHRESIVIGSSDCSGYEMRLTLNSGQSCLPFIVGMEQLRQRSSKLARGTSTRTPLGSARRGAPAAVAALSFTAGPTTTAAVSEGTVGGRERRKEVVLQAPTSPNVPTESTPPDDEGTTELLVMQLQPSVTQVLLRDLSPSAAFTVTVRARGSAEAWQPWCAPMHFQTLSPVRLEQTRVGEHYVHLLWYREDAEAMSIAGSEAAEHRQLQREFHNFTEADVQQRREELDHETFEGLISRLQRLRLLRRIASARARRHAEGSLGLLTDPNAPAHGFQLRVVDEAGTITEHYLEYNAAQPTLSFTAVGLQPNNLYVCRLCPHYGGDVWGYWTSALKFMTYNLIHLRLTYIGETFVDLEWWRLDNKPVPKLDAEDTLVSSRYTEEVQTYQLRIAHTNLETGNEVEELRDMHATNAVRIDQLLPDTKYTIAVREWDAKGDWGLWSAACVCATVPAMCMAITEVQDCTAAVAWSRAEAQVDYGDDMRVLEGSLTTTGYYVRVEEVVVSRESQAAGPSLAQAPEEHAVPATPAVSMKSMENLSLELEGTGLASQSLLVVPAVSCRSETQKKERTELEGTLGIQRCIPLPPEPHPQLHDGLTLSSPRDAQAFSKAAAASGPLVSLADTDAAAAAPSHYLLVQKVDSSEETTMPLTGLRPQTVYSAQVMAETAGGHVGSWSAPQFFITAPLLQLTATTIDEHYATLHWERPALESLVEPVTSRHVLSTVTLPTVQVRGYEVEMRGLPHGRATRSHLEGYTTTTASTAMQVPRLTMDTLFAARVRSLSEDGVPSLWSPWHRFVTLKPLLLYPREITETHVDMEWGRAEQLAEFYTTAPSEEEGQGSSGTTRMSVSGSYASSGAAESARTCSFTPTATHVTSVSSRRDSAPSEVQLGSRDAVHYHLRIYSVAASTAPTLIAEKQFNGSVTTFRAEALSSSAIYAMFVRSMNADGVWSDWSEPRCVYTMKPLVAHIATVGADFVRVQWSRAAPDEVHYSAPPSSSATDSTLPRSAIQPVRARGAADDAELSVNEGIKDGEGIQQRSPRELGDSASTVPTPDSPGAVQIWRQRRKFRQLDAPALDPGLVYRSAETSIVGYAVAVRRTAESEAITFEVSGKQLQHTIAALQPDTSYLVSVRAQYGSGTWSTWSDAVPTGTYNLLAADVKEVGEDYFSATWQRKPNVIPMPALQIGSVEETVCYEMRVRDYSDVPLGDEEGVVARQRDASGRSIFFQSTQRHGIVRGLQANRRYRISVRRWYQPLDGFAVPIVPIPGDAHCSQDTMEEDGPACSPLQLLSTEQLPPPPQTDVDMMPALRETMEAAKAVPEVWAESEYVVTLRSLVCEVERVGEEYLQLRWSRDPHTVPLPVRRAIPPRPVQAYQLHLSELPRDGSSLTAVNTSGSAMHVEEMLPSSDNSYFAKGLCPNTLYRAEVRCSIEGTWGRWSRAVYILTQARLLIELSGIGEDCASIAWRRPREPMAMQDGTVAVLADAEDADGTYQLEVNGVRLNYQLSKKFKATRDTYTVRHLDADSLYAVRVRWGDDKRDSWSLWSVVAYFATLKPLRVHLAMTADHFVDVEWSRPPQGVEEYQARMEQHGPGVADIGFSVPPVPAQIEEAEGIQRTSLPSALVNAVQLGNPAALAFHLCAFNTQETPSIAVVDKQLHKDAAHFRAGSLAADTPYVVIVRACCEATVDWGLWSEERPFRTQRVLSPTVSAVGERYVELCWELSDAADQAPLLAGPNSTIKSTTRATKYLVVLRSSNFGVVEKEVAATECAAAAVDALGLSIPLSDLHPATEYAVALQPCYGGTNDWGLWSHAALFTTLPAVRLSATVNKGVAELRWGRALAPAETTTETATSVDDAGTSVALSDPGVRALVKQSPLALLPAAGQPGGPSSIINGDTACSMIVDGGRTVQRYRLLFYAAQDREALRMQHPSLEGSLMMTTPSATPVLALAEKEVPLADKTEGAGNYSPAEEATPAFLFPVEDEVEEMAVVKQKEGETVLATAESTVALNHTTIPDMDVASLTPASQTSNDRAAEPPLFLFRKEYNLASGEAERSMSEQIEGLLADTAYVVHLQAMDMHGNWGAPVEESLITAPLPPTGPALRRVNARYCSLQWLNDEDEKSRMDGSTTVGKAVARSGEEGSPAESSARATKQKGHYRYLVEAAWTTSDAAVTASLGTRSHNLASAGTVITEDLAWEWHTVDTVEDVQVCAVQIRGLLPRLRCRVRRARRHDLTGSPSESSEWGPYSEASTMVAVTSGTPPEGVVDLHLTTLAQTSATLEWLSPPKPSEAATGRYSRPHYRVYLANTSDQPYPILLDTAHRPSYVLANLTPSTTYTVQVVAENDDGVSCRNPILCFSTKSGEDTSVSTAAAAEGEEEGESTTATASLATFVRFHGPRALELDALVDTRLHSADAMTASGDRTPEIPTAIPLSFYAPSPPSPAPPKGRGRGTGANTRRSPSKSATMPSKPPRASSLAHSGGSASPQQARTQKAKRAIIGTTSIARTKSVSMDKKTTTTRRKSSSIVLATASYLPPVSKAV